MRAMRVENNDEEARFLGQTHVASAGNLSRQDMFRQMVEILHGGHPYEVVGERGSGRSFLLQSIASYFRGIGWEIISIFGRASVGAAPLSTLMLGGIVGASDLRVAPLVLARSALAGLIEPNRTLLVVDDIDLIDDASRGVIEAVAQAQGVPVLSARLIDAYSNESQAARFLPLRHSVRLPPMDYAELETAIEVNASIRLDPPTMSRIYAKSGGNIGLSLAILDAAQRTGTIRLVGNMAHAEGPLWDTSLHSTMAAMLQGLSAEQVESLRMLSFLGPSDLTEAGAFVSETTLVELERLQIVLLVSTGDREIVVINPPMISEYFRHETPPMRRRVILSEIERVIPSASRTTSLDAQVREPALLVHLVHERTRETVFRARHAWEKKPTLATATQLLKALGTDISPADKEIRRIILQAARLEGTSHERVEWEIACALRTAHHDQRPNEAIARLREYAASLSRDHALIVNANVSTLTTAYGYLEQNEPFVDTDLDGLHHCQLTSVLLARTFWLVVQGRVEEAFGLINRYREDISQNIHIDALDVYCRTELDMSESARKLAYTRLDHAYADFDATRIRVYAFLVALSSDSLQEISEADALVAQALAVGLPRGEGPMSYVGLSILAAKRALEQGHQGMASHYLTTLESVSVSEVLPGQQRWSIDAQTARLQGQSKKAAHIARAAGDALWTKGARLAAAYAYLYGMRVHPMTAEWNRVKSRLGDIDSAVVRRHTDFSEALLKNNAHEATRLVLSAQEIGRAAESAMMARAAFDIFPNDSLSQDLEKELQEIVDAHNTRQSSISIALSSREWEIAELIAADMTNPLIAEHLVISTRTVESHIRNIIKKIAGQNRNDIRKFVVNAEKEGWLGQDPSGIFTTSTADGAES